jgi:hypothetical protein
MHEHARHIISKETSLSYCSKEFQNEFISVMASCVPDNILERAIKAKYFSTVVDSTPEL